MCLLTSVPVRRLQRAARSWRSQSAFFIISAVMSDTWARQSMLAGMAWAGCGTSKRSRVWRSRRIGHLHDPGEAAVFFYGSQFGVFVLVVGVFVLVCGFGVFLFLFF